LNAPVPGHVKDVRADAHAHLTGTRTTVGHLSRGLDPADRPRAPDRYWEIFSQTATERTAIARLLANHGIPPQPLPKGPDHVVDVFEMVEVEGKKGAWSRMAHGPGLLGLQPA
jgi:hypothetical protein